MRPLRSLNVVKLQVAFPHLLLSTNYRDRRLSTHSLDIMSSRDEELIDYEDENDITNGAPVAVQNGAAASDAVAAPAGGADADKDKKNYTGIHSTGFRSVESSGFSSTKFDILDVVLQGLFA